jgi:hypothetical protein
MILIPYLYTSFDDVVNRFVAFCAGCLCIIDISHYYYYYPYFMYTLPSRLALYNLYSLLIYFYGVSDEPKIVHIVSHHPIGRHKYQGNKIGAVSS